MDGLAVERAALAAKADSAKNSTPIQPEDRQPNESLRRRKGAGPPTVVPMSRGRMRGGMRGGTRGGRKDWGVNNQGHWNSNRHWKTQDNQQPYGGPSSRSSSQSANGGVFHQSSSYPWHNPRPDNSSSSVIANRDVPSPQPPMRRGRPLPLPPRQDNNRSDTGRTTSPVDVGNKPYSDNLPPLKPRPAFSGIVAMRTPKPAPTAQSLSPGVLKERHEEVESPRPSLERDRERSSSPKRRKIDNTRPALISNTVGESISSNDFARTTPPPELRISDEGPSTGTTTLEQPLVTPSPSTTRMLASPPIVKREPESPPSLIEIEERKVVTTYVTRFFLPKNCQKTNPQWQSNRMAFRQEKARELRKKGLELIGRCIMRDDGMCIEWKSSVPLWSDTLEPISLDDDERPSLDHVGSRFSTPTNPISPGRSHTDDAMGPPSTRRTTNVVERPSPVLPSKSPSRVSHQQARVLPLDVATVSPSPAKSDASRKSHRSLIPRGSLDLATAIEISQRTNATPSRPQSFRSSSATLGSPSALTTHHLSYPSIHSSYPAVTSPSVGLPRTPRRKRRDANLREEEADGASKGKGDDDDDVEIIEVPEQSRKMEAVKAGWTVIEDICQSSEKGGSEEDDFDELTEDKALRQMRVDEEPDQVAPISLSTEDTDEDDDTLTRNFINGYMQLFETDRDSLVSLYAPDAILRYRLLDIAQFPSTSSPRGLSSFPFMTARGHKEISSSLLTLDHIHFYQKVDEDGKNKIDLEYHREQTHDDISLYVRSTMTVDEDNEVPGTHEHQGDSVEERQQKRLVDHDFWLYRDGSTRSRSAVTEDRGPFVIRSHLIIMHEVPL